MLIGHNFNRGIYHWLGVFHSLHTMKPQDIVYLASESDEVFTYQVERVEKVPWRSYNSDALAHIVRLSPTRDETLTLVTCGGANFAPFPSRIYVIARRKLEGEQLESNQTAP